MVTRGPGLGRRLTAAMAVRCGLAGMAGMAAGGAAGCGTTAATHPLGRGNGAFEASLGGPMIGALGTKILTPILLVGGGYGLTDRAEATAQVDVTAAAFGVAHVVPGVAVHPLLSTENRALPSIGIAGSLHVLTNITDTRVAPQATAVAAWRVGQRHLVYGGVDAGVVFGSPTRVLAGPLAGAEIRPTAHLGFAIELKWLAPYYDVGPLAPDWVSPGSRGYFAVLLGFRRYIGEEKGGSESR